MVSTGKDLANSRLATPVDSTRTSIQITSGEVSMFPLGADSGEEFFITVTPYGKLPNQANSEIMRVTSVNNGASLLNVERGAKGTTAKEFLEGDIVSNGIYRDDLGGSGGGGGKKGIVYNSLANRLTLTDSDNGGASLPNIVTTIQDGVTAWNATTVNQSGAQRGFKVAPAELRISGNQLSLEGSNTVTLPSGGGGSPTQTLSLSGKKLSISQGNEVDLSPIDEKQTLSLSGTTLSISGGNSVQLSFGGGGGGQAAQIQDTGVRLFERRQENGGGLEFFIRRYGNIVSFWFFMRNPSDYASPRIQPNFTTKPLTINSKSIPAGFLPELAAIYSAEDRRNPKRRVHDNFIGPTAPVYGNLGNAKPLHIGQMAFFGWLDNKVVIEMGNNVARAYGGNITWTTLDDWPTQIPGTAFPG